MSGMKNAWVRGSVCAVAFLVILLLSGCSPSGGGEGGVATPANLVAMASPNATEISLSWAGSLPGDATFLVYRGTASGAESPTQVGASATTSYTDADPALQSSTYYYYYVVAATTSAQSGHSNEAGALTVDAGTIGITIQ
jgi:hypothetical protein